MHIDVITIFPEMFPAILGSSILKRAHESGRLAVRVHDLRDFTHDRHRSVDDRPYGGGPGMVMRPEPIFEAVESINARFCPTHPQDAQGCRTILMSPSGVRLNAARAEGLARLAHLVIICGHYEGVDERVRLGLVDDVLSIGDYVLTGGELPALVLIDGVSRFVPGVIGHAQATQEESFVSGWLEYPHYTRPAVFRQMSVPDVLRGGNHEQVAQWRRAQSVAKTLTTRPDLQRSRKTNREAY